MPPYSSLRILLVLVFASVLPASARYIKRADPAPLRDVYMSITVDLTYFDGEERSQMSSWDPQTFAKNALHPYVDIVGDGTTNGNIRIQLSEFGVKGMVAYVQDYGLNNPIKAPVSHMGRHSYVKSVKIGTININNVDLFDSATGKGKVTDVWSRNPAYKFISHDCIDFMNDMVTELGLDPGSDFKNVYANHRAIVDNVLARPNGVARDFAAENCPVVGATYNNPDDPSKPSVISYDVQDGSNPKEIDRQGTFPTSDTTNTQFDAGNELIVNDNGQQTKLGSVKELTDYMDAHPDPDAASDAQTIREQAVALDSEITPSIQATDSSSGGNPGGTSRGVATLDVEGSLELAVVRNRGVLYSIVSIAKTALVEVGGIVAIATLPFFIVLDLINGNWQAAVIGAAGGIAGLAAGLLGSGPIGLLVGAAIALFFSIFPGLFQEKANPTTDNPAKIIQFAFFGDRDHTGNEGCNKQRTDAGQSPNCTAVYGAGTIAHIFKWNIFDSIVFLLDKNNGHPMSIVDMAAALPIQDYTKPNWSANQSFYIDCGPGPAPQPLIGYSGGSKPIPGYHTVNSPSDAYDCAKPNFHINRTLVNLAALNATADKIYSRIIPAPNGDCKLYSDPVNGVNVPYFDIQVTGRPVGIECGIFDNQTIGVDPTVDTFSTNPSLKVNSTTYSSGTVLVFNATSNSTISVNTSPASNLTSSASNLTSSASNLTTSASTSTPSNSTSSAVNTATQGSTASNSLAQTVSTDNSTLRAYRTAPAPVPFMLLNSTNSACFTAPKGGNLCLLSGMYDPPDGSYGINAKDINTLTFPAGSHIDYTYPSIFDDGDVPSLIKQYPDQASSLSNTTTNYDRNIAAGSGDSTDLNSDLILLTQAGDQFNLTVTNSAPGVCLYTRTNYRGNAACFGLGASNITTSTIGVSAKSITVKMGAYAWLYSGKYGDLTGSFVNTDVPDLTQVADGSELNFANRIKAMWIGVPV